MNQIHLMHWTLSFVEYLFPHHKNNIREIAHSLRKSKWEIALEDKIPKLLEAASGGDQDIVDKDPWSLGAYFRMYI